MREIFFFFFLALAFVSCRDSMTMIKDTFDIELQKSVEYYSEQEQWNDFNGDGYRIVIYDVKDGHELEVQSLMESKGAIYMKNYLNSELKECVLSDSVYILEKDLINDDELRRLLYDPTQKKIIYHYMFY